jgi:molecular chaperone HtpG
MRLPERPAKITDLDLMARLLAYAEGRESWPSDRTLGEHEKNACRQLHANLTSFVERCLHPLMDRVTAREMEAFTMHDHGHGLKVAHIMWHIIDPIRRNSLTPGEIALLVISAHLHDLGLGLSKEEREARLRPESDLWDRLDGDGAYAAALARLANIATQTTAGNSRAAEAAYQVQQAQEALLCIDCRERHATRERYEEILQSLQEMHRLGPATIPDPKAALSFDGDSYQEKLIEICVSHNEDVQTLLERDPRNIDQWRFPTDYPIGCCNADTRFVATTLRLADILDFDRERTPPVSFYYLLPKSGDPSGNTSIREWSKHLAVLL